MKGKTKVNNVLVGVFLVVVIIGAVFFVGNYTGFIKGQIAQPSGGGVAQPAAPTTDLRNCQGITALKLSTAVRNPLNSTTQYLASKVDAVVSGQVVGTVTTTAGSTLSFADLTFPCTMENFAGDVYVIATSTQNSAHDTYSISGTSATKTLNAPPAGAITLTWLDFNTGVNTSVASTATTQGTAVALDAGQSVNAKLLVTPPSAAFSQYGSTDGGVLIAINTVNSAAYTDKAVALSSSDVPLTEVVCTSYAKEASVDNAKRCYKTGAISTNSAASIISVRIANDGGASAGASDDPVVYFEPIQYYEDTDGTIKIGAFNTGGTAVGLSASKATFNAS